MQVLGAYIPRRALLLAGVDFLVAGSCFAASYLLLATSVDQAGVFTALLSAAVTVSFHQFLEARGYIERKSRVLSLVQLTTALGVVFIVQGAAAYLSGLRPLPLGFTLLASVLLIGVYYFIRPHYQPLLVKLTGTDRLLFIGCNETARAVIAEIRARTNIGIEVAGAVAAAGETVPSGVRRFESVAAAMEATQPHRIVIDATDWRNRVPLRLLADARSRGVRVETAGRLYEATLLRVSSADLRPSAVILRNELGSRPGNLAIQSVYTNVLAIACLALAAPFMVLFVILIRRSSSGPAVAKERMRGLHGIPFDLYKLRCTDQTGHLTGIGRWLSAHHLHRLPQLWNVLRGEMALIGPAAARAEIEDHFGSLVPFALQKHHTKPGIVGWSQINVDEESGITDSLERLEYDLYYIKHTSLALDIYIVLHSLRAALLGEARPDIRRQAASESGRLTGAPL
jgi:lipopolysaccharide/colanic/teichoic acid biosynthesis glycosyltransferase